MAGSSHHQHTPNSSHYFNATSNGLTPNMNNSANALSDHLSRLSLTNAARTLPPTSPLLSSPSMSSERPLPQPRNASTPRTPKTASSKPPTPRRTPSTTSLRDERRLSTPSLQKRLSTSSLRSVYNSGGTPSRPSLSRRSSASYLPSPTPTTMRVKVSLDTTVEVPVPTAEIIAAEHFGKEMQLHQSTDLASKTLVVIQDACYGHRFSRPKTSKAVLSTIVERPERIRATVLGLAAAYVRIGKRHAGEPFAPRPDLAVNLLPIPFQIRKTSRSVALNSPAVTHVHGSNWMDDLKMMCDVAESRLALNGKELVRPRNGERGDSASAPQFHEGDLYLCQESLDAFQGALGGVCEAVDAVFSPNPIQRAFVCIRPPGHHCSSNHPSGFCWLNNVHVGIAHAAMMHGLTHAAILDFDLHHGDGSQAIAWEQNRRAISAARNAAGYKKTVVGYYSLHDINSYPCEMGEGDKVRNASACLDNAHGQSVWNVHLEPWKSSTEFWRLYNEKYALLIDKARNFLRFHTNRLLASPNSPPPRAAIFLSAGFDASEWEGAGMQRHKVNVPADFYARFTVDVVKLAEEEGLATDGRIISVLEGGYSDRALTSGVLSHISGLADTHSSEWTNPHGGQSRLASEMTERLGLDETPRGPALATDFRAAIFDTEWWGVEALEELECLMNPPLAPLSKKPREKIGPTFHAPTQSSAAKVITPTKDRKRTGIPGDPDACAPPPFPDVDWATAAHELFKVLIPNDRQTTSYRPEDLNAEASRLRRERFVTAEPPATPVAADETRMQLRKRRPKPSSPADSKLEMSRRTSSRSSRRTTLTSVNDLPDPTLEMLSATGFSRHGRRQSVSPSVGSHAGDLAEHGKGTPARLASNGLKTNSRLGPGVGAQPLESTAIKKTRTADESYSPTPKRVSSPKKAPPVPKVPASYLNEFSATSPVEEQPGMDLWTAPKESHPTSGIGKDLDSLTAGVRKLNIKLRVPSPTTHKKRVTEEREKAAFRVLKKPTGPNSINSASTKYASKDLSPVENFKQNSSPESSNYAAEETKTEDRIIGVVEAVEAVKSSSSPTCQSPTRSTTLGATLVESRASIFELPTDRSQARMVEAAQQPVSAPTWGNPQAREHHEVTGQLPPALMELVKHRLPVHTPTGPTSITSAGTNGICQPEGLDAPALSQSQRIP